MKQGEIWNADLNPVRGSEQAGFRPVVIISGNLLNEFLNVIIVVPLTSQVKNYKGNPVLSPTRTNGLTKESEMLMFHVRSVSKSRLVEKVGSINAVQLEQAVKTLNDIIRY